MNYLKTALVLLSIYAAIYLAVFPNNLDTVSHYGTAIIQATEGYSQYAFSWYAGSPTNVVYVLGFYLVHLVSKVVDVQTAYLLVDFSAIAVICAGFYALAKATGLDKKKSGLALLLFVASYGFFYSWIRVDRFPTMLGTAFALPALAIAYSVKEKPAFSDLLKIAGLLTLSTYSSIHVGLITAVGVIAIVFARTKVKTNLIRIENVGVGAIALAALYPLVQSILEFRQFVNPNFTFGLFSPVVALSWLGPVFSAAVAYAVFDKISGRDSGMRRGLIGATIIAAGAAFLLLGFGQNTNQLVLLALFSIFLILTEAIGLVKTSFEADHQFVAALALIAAALSGTFFLPAFSTLNPAVYVLFAGAFASLWLARNWTPVSAAGAVFAIVLSIPFAALATPDYLEKSDSPKQITQYLESKDGFGRVLYDSCPHYFSYAALESGKLSVNGVVFYPNIDPNTQKLEGDRDRGPMVRTIANNPTYQVRFIVSCDKQNDYSSDGFEKKLETGDSIVWEKPGSYAIADVKSSYSTGRVLLEAQVGSIASIKTNYYPALECSSGCEIVEGKPGETIVKMTKSTAALSTKGDFFTKISFSVVIALLMLVCGILVKK